MTATRGSLLLVLIWCLMQDCDLCQADEGMWLLNEAPKEILQKKYQYELTDEFLEKIMKANVRFNSGGSGGFVSSRGLVVTNHHIAADALQKLSDKDHDYYHEGFYARRPEQELKCPDLELNVLQAIVDVTAEVKAAVTRDMSPEAAAAARRARMSKIEKESLKKTGLRSDVVTLYQGAVFHLYQYRKYTDVRLVFAPESHAAGFGGDVDNFEYPRHGLDVAFFRVYDNGKPLQNKHYFPWSTKKLSEGDLVFVTGHPGTTNRLETLDKLRYRRDHTLPFTLNRLRVLEAALLQFAEQGPEQSRRASNDIQRVANARKALSGQLQGLLNPTIMQQKQTADERVLKEAPATVKRAYQEIAEVQKNYQRIEKEYSLFELNQALFSELFITARHLVRLAEELPKKSGDRLREYRDSNLESLKYKLFSPAPLYPDLERAKLKASLTFMAEVLGGDHEIVKIVLAGKNPESRAQELVQHCELFQVEARKGYWQKDLVDRSKIAESQDAMIQLARALDQVSRKYRKQFEAEVEEREVQAYSLWAKQLVEAAAGKQVAPDATFTLRVAFGTVRGYEVDGEKLPFQTTFDSAFQRADAMKNREPFNLPARWLQGKAKLNLQTPFNFVSTADTIGGNSGSPVLNRAGELIGINFDRNRHGLVRNFVYTDFQARHISVHAQAVLEALIKLYEAEDLHRELTNHP